MTKAEHKQRAMDLAYQVKHCYAESAKRQMAGKVMEILRRSLGDKK